MVLGEIKLEDGKVCGRFDISDLKNGGYGYAVRISVPDQSGKDGAQSIEFFLRENENGTVSDVSVSVQYFPRGGTDPREIFPSDGDYVLGYNVWFDPDATKIGATKCVYRQGEVVDFVGVESMEEANEYTPTVRDFHSYQLWLDLLREYANR
jgi:hypothetical protein